MVLERRHGSLAQNRSGNVSCDSYSSFSKRNAYSDVCQAEHSANLRLCLETSELYLDTPPKMSFDMALTYWDVHQPTADYQVRYSGECFPLQYRILAYKPQYGESAPSNQVFLTRNLKQNPVLLAIETTVEATTVASNYGKTTVRFSGTGDPEGFKPVHRKSVGLGRKGKEIAGRTSGFRGLLKKLKGQHAESSNNGTNPMKPIVASPDTPAEPLVPNLGSVPDLCLCILETSRSVVDCDACVGYLTGVGTGKYMVYTRQADPSSFGCGTISLSKMIASHRRQQYLPKPDKWRLAGALSLAVLLYHSTPWLQTELKSDDILFFGSDDRGRKGLLNAPHLHSFQRHKGKAFERISLSGNDGRIKNEMLYCLGVVLLEIEFEDTLESLIVDSTLDGAANLQQLMLLKRRAGRELGTLYGRIIRMCLDCDFGLGLDEYTLDDPRVQKIFYAQVVRQFQERMPEYDKIWSDE